MWNMFAEWEKCWLGNIKSSCGVTVENQLSKCDMAAKESVWIWVCDVTRGDSGVEGSHWAVTVMTAQGTCQECGEICVLLRFYVPFFHNCYNYSLNLSDFQLIRHISCYGEGKLTTQAATLIWYLPNILHSLDFFLFFFTPILKINKQSNHITKKNNQNPPICNLFCQTRNVLDWLCCDFQICKNILKYLCIFTIKSRSTAAILLLCRNMQCLQWNGFHFFLRYC